MGHIDFTRNAPVSNKGGSDVCFASTSDAGSLDFRAFIISSTFVSVFRVRVARSHRTKCGPGGFFMDRSTVGSLHRLKFASFMEDSHKNCAVGIIKRFGSFRVHSLLVGSPRPLHVRVTPSSDVDP